MDLAAHIVPRSPVVSRSCAFLVYVEILWVVDVLVWPGLDTIDHSRLQIEEDGTRDVSRVVGLVEEDIFAIASLSREVFEVAVLVDAVFQAELTPELRADCMKLCQSLLVRMFVITVLVGATDRCCRIGLPGS